ncbi:hypothetical protein [Fodinibius sediminis]|nr:hypothetical protein [Fodinibius sediminis]
MDKYPGNDGEFNFSALAASLDADHPVAVGADFKPKFVDSLPGASR